MAITKIEKLKCGKCTDGIVARIHRETKDDFSIEIKKCTECGHQYFVKGSYELKKISSVDRTEPEKETQF